VLFLKIAIKGGTGLIGQALCQFFLEKGVKVYLLTRKPKYPSEHANLTYIHAENLNMEAIKIMEGIDVIINLAGESINSGRWNAKRKDRILKSRLQATNQMMELIHRLEHKPKLLINASAIGFYGTSNDLTFTEESSPVGEDFLAETVKQWEESALKAEELGVRTVFMRFGIVLSKMGGALPKMTLPYRFFIGGTIGKGKQWVSWIHIEDVVQAVDHIIVNETLSGPVNFVSPEPLQMKNFGKQIAAVLNRPHWLNIPEFAMKILLGEMSLLMLEGQKVLPKKLLHHGFHFKFPSLNEALKNIFHE
jgi:uncharacterized protein